MGTQVIPIQLYIAHSYFYSSRVVQLIATCRTIYALHSLKYLLFGPLLKKFADPLRQAVIEKCSVYYLYLRVDMRDRHTESRLVVDATGRKVVRND